MSVFEYADYKAFLKETIKALPKQGRGQARRLAEHLRVNSVVVSQILSGGRHFTTEQALQTAVFFGLDERATEYFLTLINQARAGTKDLEKYYESKLTKMRREHLDLKNRVVQGGQLTDPDKGIFYSNWFYSGIRLLSSIEGYNSVDAIATYFGMSRAKVAEAVAFLVSRGLCQEVDGKITLGMTATYVDQSSPFVNSHRRNWRMKGLERFTEPGHDDMFYSAPFSLSAKDAEHIRKELVKLVAETSKRVADSPCEELRCLNIDWFKF